MLSQYQTDQLQQVIDIIAKTVSPEKIFLLGVSYTRQYEENIFMQSAPEPACVHHITQYNLLVLTQGNDSHCHLELQDTIENRCHNVMPVTLFIETAQLFTTWLLEANHFAVMVCKKGLLVYDAGLVVLPTPATLNEVTNHALLRKEFIKRNQNVTEFLAGSELFVLRKQFTLAAFLLHQAAEQAFTILIRIVTGYLTGTHNLDKLLRYAKPFSTELALLFQRHTDADYHLFRLLQDAYIHARYREDYHVKERELHILTDRVKKLQAIARKIASERSINKNPVL